MTFDFLFSRTAEDFIGSLAREQWRDLEVALEELRANPYADGETKVYLPMPYKPGTLAFASRGFVMTYQILVGLCIQVFGIRWDRW